jgi:DNA polymerase elongation subunit (family B)
MEEYITVGELSNYSEEYEVWDEEMSRWVSIQDSCYLAPCNNGAFPDPEFAEEVINLLTCYDSLSKRYTVFGLKAYKPSRNDVDYHHCKSEEDLLKRFIGHFSSDYPDCLVGWNSAGFDIVYLINRITFTIGKEWADELSPMGRIYEKINKDGKFGQPSKEYVIEGISCLDYFVMYKKFSMQPLENYKLDYVAEVELNENKVSYEGSLWELSVKDWDTYVNYNIVDVELIIKLDEKLKYIDLLRFLAYLGLCNMENAIKTVPLINGAVAIRARHRNEKIPTFIRPKTEGKIPGGFVAEPKIGFCENLVSFDANSLYPSIMISLNLSPETKLGKVEKVGDIMNVHHVSGRTYELSKENFVKYIKEESAALTKAGFLFSQKKKGLMPEFLDFLYSKRKEMKSKMIEMKREYLNIKDTLSKEDKFEYETNIQKFNTFQHAYKITLNSTYGYCANKYAPLGDDDIGSSVTLTGQETIKKSNDIFLKFLENNFSDMTEAERESTLIYNDTDSVVGDTIINTNFGNLKISDIWDNNQNIDKIDTTQFGHEMINVEGLLASSYDKKSKTHKMSKVSKVFRHKVSKRKFKIISEGKEVIITEDHGLMVYRNNEFIRISPLEYKPGDKLVIETEENVSL